MNQSFKNESTIEYYVCMHVCMYIHTGMHTYTYSSSMFLLTLVSFSLLYNPSAIISLINHAPSSNYHYFRIIYIIYRGFDFRHFSPWYFLRVNLVWSTPIIPRLSKLFFFFSRGQEYNWVATFLRSSNLFKKAHIDKLDVDMREMCLD